MRISVIGTGYVGLVTGVGLASLDHHVICVDSDAKKVRAIGQGKAPIYEKGLEELLKCVLESGNFAVTTNLESAVMNSEVTFICVGTPAAEKGNIDLSQVKAVSRELGSVLRRKTSYHLVVVKSTVIPGTCSETILPLVQESSGKTLTEFGLCMNPEFLREGNALEDFLNPDRIVIGEQNSKSGELLAKVYSRFDVPFLRVSLETAEMIKYTSNALLGNLISFSNEIANICERIPDVDVADVLGAIRLDKRLSPIVAHKRVAPQILSYLMAGCGFGGSCLPKDISALIRFSRLKGYEPKLLSSILGINEERPLHLVELAEKELGSLAGKKVAVLGLAFKPETDDLRDSPAIPVVRKLVEKKATVSVYDPRAIENARAFFREVNLKFCHSVEQALKGADVCILVTNWDEFKKITPELLTREMKHPVLVDGRRLLQGKDFQGKGKYVGIGISRPTTKPDPK